MLCAMSKNLCITEANCPATSQAVMMVVVALYSTDN